MKPNQMFGRRLWGARALAAAGARALSSRRGGKAESSLHLQVGRNCRGGSATVETPSSPGQRSKRGCVAKTGLLPEHRVWSNSNPRQYSRRGIAICHGCFKPGHCLDRYDYSKRSEAVHGVLSRAVFIWTCDARRRDASTADQATSAIPREQRQGGQGRTPERERERDTETDRERERERGESNMSDVRRGREGESKEEGASSNNLVAAVWV